MGTSCEFLHIYNLFVLLMGTLLQIHKLNFHRLPSMIRVGLNLFQSYTNKDMAEMFGLPIGPEQIYSRTVPPSCTCLRGVYLSKLLG